MRRRPRPPCRAPGARRPGGRLEVRRDKRRRHVCSPHRIREPGQAIRTTVALPLLWGLWLVARAAGTETHGPLERASAGTTWKLILGSGLAAGAAGTAFFYLALARGEVSRVKPIAFGLAPATAVALGVLFLGEGVSVAKIAGLLLVVAGVVLLTTG